MNKSIIGKISKKAKTIRVVVVLGLLSVLLSVLFTKSFAIPLEDDVRVDPNSELKYFLNISYDGADKNGVKSDNTTVSEISSGYLYVEDKIPDGLIFTGFEVTKDGSIGAVKRSDGTTCTGKVIDDTPDDPLDKGKWSEDEKEFTYHGLHYNEDTRTVSFKIKNLKAGCELTVGIITETPTIDDPETEEKEKRRDFYNFATAREDSLTVNSNTVHAFMGSEFATLYKVSYEYEYYAEDDEHKNVSIEKVLPPNVPTPPSETEYAEGITVGIAPNVKVEGYTFRGWTTSDVQINENSTTFKMPANNVVLKGYFKKDENSTYKVTYKLMDGTTPPPGYVLPKEKNYNAGATVNVDSLKVGDIFNGYRFLGWKIDNVDISEDNNFEMPEEDIIIIGEFEEVTYNVIYQFYDTILPNDWEKYLPKSKTYKPGEKVKLEDVIGEPTGYKFLGWYKEKEFKMPDNDVIIYGEWKVLTGTFSPTITKEVINKKDLYEVGDTVEFKITVKNTATFDITKVIVKENNENATFIEGDGYEVITEHVSSIPVLNSGESVEIAAEYTVTEEDSGWVINEVEIRGALADNNYELEDKDYKATATFKTPVKEDNNTNNDVVKSDNPNTLDNILRYVVMGIISLVTIIGICLYIKKMKKD